jgi:hypothetical protein
MARRWVYWWDNPDGSSVYRLNLKPGQEIWDYRAAPDCGLLEVNILVEDNCLPLIREHRMRCRQTATAAVVRELVEQRMLTDDEAISCKYYRLPPLSLSEPKRWVEYACLD